MKYDWMPYEKLSSVEKIPVMVRLSRNKLNLYVSFKRIWNQKTLDLEDKSILMQNI